MEGVLDGSRSDALRQFDDLKADAVSAVTGSFFSGEGSPCARFGPAGRVACHEDLTFHLEFLRPVLEFGLLEPMVHYLLWLRDVLQARGIPVEHLALSLQRLEEYFAGRTPAAEGGVVATALRDSRAAFLKAIAEPAKPSPALPQWPEAIPFEAALLAGDHRAAMSVIDRCIDEGLGLVLIEQHVIRAALQRIGERWQANEVSVAQEHLATAIVQSVMTVGLLRSLSPPPTGKRALLACIQGNHHAVGLRMVADAFQLAGWEVQYLGASVPSPALLKQVVTWAPDLIGLSISFPQQIRSVREFMELLRLQAGRGGPAVMLGGLAINRFRPLADMVGADACPVDPSAAVQYASQLSPA